MASIYIDFIYFPVLLQYDECEKRREMAKNSLERYTHYYERWASNQSVCTGLPAYQTPPSNFCGYI